MTDKEALLALLERFGLQPSSIWSSEERVTLEAKEGGVHGYTGFVVDFEFDKDGKFTEVGIWE